MMYDQTMLVVRFLDDNDALLLELHTRDAIADLSLDLADMRVRAEGFQFDVGRASRVTIEYDDSPADPANLGYFIPSWGTGREATEGR